MRSCQRNNIIAVCASAKGVGGTFFVSTLGQTLSLKHRKVLLFDADDGAENVAIILNLKNTDAYEDMLKGALTRVYPKGRFDVVSANPGQGKLKLYPVGRAQILALDLKNFAGCYDDVLIDCADGNCALQNIMIATAARVVLIVTPSKSDLTGAYRQLEKIKRIAPKAEILVVVNRALNSAEGERTFLSLSDAARKFMNIDIRLLGVVNQDGRIRDCAFNKTTLFERYPNSESLQSVALMADIIQKEEKNDL